MTTEIQYQEEAEKMAETAEKLAEKHQRDKQIPQEEGVYQLPVVGAEQKSHEIVFTVLLGRDEKREVTVDYPEDTQDREESLVRLLEWKDIGFQSFSQIGEIPVYTDGNDGRYELCVPNKSTLDSITIGLTENTTYKSPERGKVSITYRPITWLTIGLMSLAGATAITHLLAGLPQLLSNATILSTETGILFAAILLLLAGFRTLWESYSVFSNRI